MTAADGAKGHHMTEDHSTSRGCGVYAGIEQAGV